MLRVRREIHCQCESTICDYKGNVFPLACELLKENLCPISLPCPDHEDSPNDYRRHINESVLSWLGVCADRKDIIITVPCDSTDAWIVAAFDAIDDIENIKNPWESVISKKKEYHGVRIPGHKKNNRVYQQLLPVLEDKWKQVIDLCDSAKIFEKSIQEAWKVNL